MNSNGKSNLAQSWQTKSLGLAMRILCLSFGLLMLFVAVSDLFAPRARYVSSRPEPGSRLTAAPAEIVVTFSRGLHPRSRIQVICTASLLPSGEMSYSGGTDVVAESGLNPDDLSQHSLRAVLRTRLSDGLYRVDWTTMAERDGAERFGSYYFGVGLPVPEHIASETGNLPREQDVGEYWESSRRAAVVGGVFLIVLAVLLPRLRLYLIKSM